MKNDVKTNIEIEEFIRDYLARHHSTDRCDQLFHEKFSEKFGGKRTIYPFGACPNHLAMTWLKRLYDEGTLKRYSVGLQFHETGFPNWVYCYELART